MLYIYIRADSQWLRYLAFLLVMSCTYTKKKSVLPIQLQQKNTIKIYVWVPVKYTWRDQNKLGKFAGHTSIELQDNTHNIHYMGFQPGKVLPKSYDEDANFYMQRPADCIFKVTKDVQHDRFQKMIEQIAHNKQSKYVLTKHNCVHIVCHLLKVGEIDKIDIAKLKRFFIPRPGHLSQYLITKPHIYEAELYRKQDYNCTIF